MIAITSTRCPVLSVFQQKKLPEMCVWGWKRKRADEIWPHLCSGWCRNHVVCVCVWIRLLTQALCVFCRRTPVSLWPSSCSPCSCARTESPCSPEDGRSFRASECCQVNAGLAPCLCLSFSPTRHFEKWIAVALNTVHLGFTSEFKESCWLLGNWKGQYKPPVQNSLGLIRGQPAGASHCFTDCLVSASPFLPV